MKNHYESATLNAVLAKQKVVLPQYSILNSPNVLWKTVDSVKGIQAMNGSILLIDEWNIRNA